MKDFNDNYGKLPDFEMLPELSDIKEQQLSVLFEENPPERPGIMSAQDYLDTRSKLDRRDERAEVVENTESETKAVIKETIEKVRPHLPQNPIFSEKPEKKAEEEQQPPEPPPAPLSDMEVMEHTASVWQYKEIADDGTELHSEYHQKRTEARYAEVIGARVRGKKHKHDGSNCDDYFETAVTDDFVVVAVCDGAGSKHLSRIGSRVSAEAAVSYLKSELTRLFGSMPALKTGLCAELNSAEFIAACGRIAPLVQQSAREAFAAQKKMCKELCEGEERETYEKALGRNPIISDLYSTFLAAVIVPLEINGKRECFMACVQIGDGCICAVNSEADSSHSLKIMGEADSGAFSGETEFITEKNIKPEAISAKTRISRGASDTIMLMTDGVADDYFPNAPQMLRLWLDLGLNGIIPMKGELGSGEDPAPIRFRSVSMAQTSVALQYAKQLLADKDEINGLWDKRDVLRCHSLEAFRMNIGDSPEERLRVWLDNYNERGSFDDRTLVVVRIK